MKTSKNGLNIIKKSEGLRLNSYKCPADVWTIGYGHTKGVKRGQKITEAKATEYLKGDVGVAERAISMSVKADVTQNQYDALASFILNVGAGAFKKSTLLRKLNKGDYLGAADQFKRWKRGGGKVLKGLVRRRAEEAALFLSDEKQEPIAQSVQPSSKTADIFTIIIDALIGLLKGMK